jgi:hypothetical protein
MDLNLVRRRREREIARDVEREFMRNITSTETVAPRPRWRARRLCQCPNVWTACRRPFWQLAGAGEAGAMRAVGRLVVDLADPGGPRLGQDQDRNGMGASSRRGRQGEPDHVTDAISLRPAQLKFRF